MSYKIFCELGTVFGVLLENGGVMRKRRILLQVRLSFFKSVFEYYHNIAQFHDEGAGDTVQGFKCRFALATFYGAQVRPANVSKTAEDFLRDAFFIS